MKQIAFLIFVVILSSCQQENKEKTQQPKQESIMYEASELALLMRAMHEQSAQWKKALETDADQYVFPTGYLNLTTAVATNPAEIDEKFYPLAENFIEHTQKFIKADKSTKPEAFNLMITSCITCHESYCRGPIVKIKKLYLE